MEVVGEWRNGRRACLRSMWLRPCGFESRLPHQGSDGLQKCEGQLIGPCNDDSCNLGPLGCRLFALVTTNNEPPE